MNTPANPLVSPLAQSVTIGLRAVYAGIALLAVAWLVSGLHEVPPDQQAVVQRFGRIVGVSGPGRLFAWPAPFEQVHMLPSLQSQASRPVAIVPRTSRDGAAPYLTGDGGVVLLDAKLVYHIDDAAAFLLAEPHVPPALDRAFRAAAVAVAARHPLDDFLVADPERGSTGADGGNDRAAVRQAVLAELVAAMNVRLAELGRQGAGLGVVIEHIDLTPRLPEIAKAGFDAVLTATQSADKIKADARTTAEVTRQKAEQDRDKRLDAARATAAQWLGQAKAETAAITALTPEAASTARSALFERLWRERVAKLLSGASQVITLDPDSGARVILPESKP